MPESRLSENVRTGLLVFSFGIGSIAVGLTANSLLKNFSKPPISSSPANIFMGHVEMGSYAIKDVLLRNDSDKPLVLDRVDTSCGCTTVATIPDVILPHETAHLQIKYNSDNRVGVFKQYVWANFKDYQGKPVVIPITGDIVKQFAVEPPVIALGKLRIGQAVSGQVLLRPLANYQPNFSVSQAPKYITANIHLLADGKMQLNWRLTTDSSVGQHNEAIELAVGNNSSCVLPVKFDYRVSGIYLLSSETVNLDVVDPMHTKKSQIEIVGKNADKMKISTFPDGCSATITPKSHDRCTLTVATRPKGGKNDIIDTLVVLSTGNEIQPEIRIPIYGTFSKQPLASNSLR